MSEEAYLSHWKSILEDRTKYAVEKFKEVKGVRALILGGSLGADNPWPLSDIDIIPIYDDDRFCEANEQVKQIRLDTLKIWKEQGWRTALDVGTLYFRVSDVRTIIQSSAEELTRLLENRSLYHSLDKGYQGKAVYDPDGLGIQFVRWFNRYRFDSGVISIRLNTLMRSFKDNIKELAHYMGEEQFVESTFYLNEAVEQLRTYLLESWGERDHSFARIGTRFETIAHRKNQDRYITILNELKTLDNDSVLRRLNNSPPRIKERHRLSYKCRHFIGEELSVIQDARDVLRVFARYGLQEILREPVESYPEWLGIVNDPAELQRRHQLLVGVSKEIFADR